MAQPKVNPEYFIYLLMDTTHSAYNGRINSMRARQLQILPDNLLSINLSDDETKALVKIAGATPGFKQGKSWMNGVEPGISDLYDRDDHSRAATLINTSPDWTLQRNNNPPGN